MFQMNSKLNPALTHDGASELIDCIDDTSRVLSRARDVLMRHFDNHVIADEAYSAVCDINALHKLLLVMDRELWDYREMLNREAQFGLIETQAQIN